MLGIVPPPIVEGDESQVNLCSLFWLRVAASFKETFAFYCVSL